MISDKDIIYHFLVDTVGVDYVVKDTETMSNYTTDLSFVSGIKPTFVVFPEKTSDIW